MAVHNDSKVKTKLKQLEGNLWLCRAGDHGPVLGWLVSLQRKTKQMEPKFSKMKGQIISLIRGKKKKVWILKGHYHCQLKQTKKQTKNAQPKSWELAFTQGL